MLALMASSASLSAARFAHKYKVEREEAIQAAIDFARAGSRYIGQSNQIVNGSKLMMDDYKHGYRDGRVPSSLRRSWPGPTARFVSRLSHVLVFFSPQIEALKTRFRVVAIDGPGVNLSSKPQNIELYKLENLALQIDELARHLSGDEPFYLVGHDWGGALAWAYAQRHPQRLHKVVAINAPPANQLIELLASNTEQQKRRLHVGNEGGRPPQSNDRKRCCQSLGKSLRTVQRPAPLHQRT